MLKVLIFKRSLSLKHCRVFKKQLHFLFNFFKVSIKN